MQEKVCISSQIESFKQAKCRNTYSYVCIYTDGRLGQNFKKFVTLLNMSRKILNFLVEINQFIV